MAKHSKATFLPRKVQRNLEVMGEQMKLARKRRGLSLATIAERAQCTQLTLMRVEKGVPTVSIGIYARVLYALGLDEDILLLARNDEAGNALVNTKLMKKNQRNEEDYDVFD
ncbi:MAG: helix-turn-helix domain-containing protein [Bacteroidales bacterium]|nr:helix-turn-helix domain-containing protein [Bacteroidales bacterium]